MEQGWEPGVKKYFRKILSTLGWTVLWVMLMAIAGLYLGMARSHSNTHRIIFYVLFGTTFVLLLRYYYRTWKK